MRTTRIAAVSAVLCTGLAIGLAAHAQAVPGAKSVTPKEIQFTQHPMLPKGAMTAVIAGDPATGAAILRVKVPANTKILPHSHVVEHQLTVLSGTLYYAEGDKYDEKKLKAYPAGSFIAETAKQPHFSMTKTQTEFQVSAPGKSSFDYVDPKDAPAKKDEPARKEAPAKK